MASARESTGFDAGSLELGYRFLDAVEDDLLDAIVTHPLGELEPRVAAVQLLRQRLLEGALPRPEEMPWPQEPAGSELLGQLRELGLARFCRQQPELTDAVIRSVLEELGRHTNELADRLVVERNRLRAEAVSRRVQQLKKRGGGSERGGAKRRRDLHRSGEEGAAIDLRTTLELDVAELRAIEEEARRIAERNFAEVRLRMHRTWADRVKIWAQLADMFGELGALIGAGWDMARGLLQTRGWLEVARLRRLLEEIAPLAVIVRMLGRMRTPLDSDDRSVLEEIVGPMRRAMEDLREVQSPLAIAEMRGIERSDEIARMLPSEALLLCHPVLKPLWHARRIERALFTYRVEGTETERVPGEETISGSRVVKKPRPDRGPIIICLDTSGSMAGLPEQVAKALTLEVLRVAHGEKRRCFAYAFSGPGDVTEHELELTPAGLARLMAFLTQSFYGGTDVSEPLRRAVERLERPEWSRGDLLIVSDGEFALPPQAQAAIDRLRKAGEVRVHGVLIGTQAAAMAAICEPLHRFGDWRSMAEASVAAMPVPPRVEGAGG